MQCTTWGRHSYRKLLVEGVGPLWLGRYHQLGRLNAIPRFIGQSLACCGASKRWYHWKESYVTPRVGRTNARSQSCRG